MSDVWNSEAETGSSMSYTSPSHNQNQVVQRSDKSSSSSSEQVRSRWTPKPEQILILESIFNSGMVNPPKDETVRIRRLLEKFGPVGDANVFYWFQNRRSRSRRRQRQIQANIEATRNAQNTIHYDPTNSNFHNNNINNMINIPTHASAGSCGTSMPHFFIPSSSEILSASSSSNLGSTGFGSSGGTVEGSFFSEMGYEDMEENGPSFLTSDVPSDLQYQQQQPGGGGGFVTVFINGVPTEVPMGPLDMKEMCGQDVLLVHSSGHPVSINEFGFSTHSLQHGESYFLVGK
ncbi:unnamed protein product [Rhodiola kirilowii]